jgi:hypothetical protein
VRAALRYLGSAPYSGSLGRVIFGRSGSGSFPLHPNKGTLNMPMRIIANQRPACLIEYAFQKVLSRLLEIGDHFAAGAGGQRGQERVRFISKKPDGAVREQEVRSAGV